MKTIASLWIVLVTACGSNPPPTQPPSNGSAAPELTCKTAVDHAATVTKLRHKDVTMAIGECEEQAWSRQLRECVNAAKAPPDIADCASKNGAEKHGIFALGGFAEAMKKMRYFKDGMCACKDTACATKVSDEMTKWAQDEAKNDREPPKMSEDDIKEATAIGEAMGSCMQKAMTPATP